MKVFKLAASSVATMVLSGNLLAQQPIQTQSVPQRSDAQVQATVQSQQETHQLPGNSIRGNNVGSQPGASQNQQSGQHAGQHAQSKEQHIAHCLKLANREEVELAKLVGSKVKDKGVQEFASMMEQDHSQMLMKLESISPGGVNTQTNPGQVSAEQAKRGELSGVSGSAASGNTTASTNSTIAAKAIDPNAGVAQGQSSSDMLQIQNEVAQQCLADTKKMLSDKEGSDLDKCYVGHQIVQHGAMISKLTVFERHTTGELKSLISQGLDTTKKHMKYAEKLMENLAQNDSGASNRNSDNQSKSKSDSE